MTQATRKTQRAIKDIEKEILCHDSYVEEHSTKKAYILL